MPFTILLTGFGPFPGAPFNPTGALVAVLARRPHAHAGVRRVAHVFATSYETVDRELPALIAREQPAALVMFGLARRTKHLRIETSARNVLSRIRTDVAGRLPAAGTIAPDGPPTLALPAPARHFLAAARSTGMTATLSHDAGSYLCNYLCWRASETAKTPSGPCLVTFVHVPLVRPLPSRIASADRAPRTLGDLVHAGEAIIKAATVAARMRR